MFVVALYFPNSVHPQAYSMLRGQYWPQIASVHYLKPPYWQLIEPDFLRIEFLHWHCQHLIANQLNALKLNSQPMV